MNTQESIRQRFSALSPALQLVARYLLEHPAEVVTHSMRHIGVAAGSTPATLVRFAQQMGFAGWPQLKAAFVDDLGLTGATYGARAQQLVGRAGQHGLADEMFEEQRQNLQTTQALSASRLDAVCALLEQAATVHAAGFRACYPLSFAFVYQYKLFRPSVQLIDGQGGLLEMQQRAMVAGDVLFVASFAPYSREAMAVAQAARRAGCRTVAMTDGAASPLALLADELLLFSTQSPSFFPSVAAAMALTEALVEMLAVRAGRPAAQRIGDAERQLFESGAYLQAPPQRGR